MTPNFIAKFNSSGVPNANSTMSDNGATVIVNNGKGPNSALPALEIASGRLSMSSPFGDIQFVETADLIAHATTVNPSPSLPAFRVDVGTNLKRALTLLNNGNLGLGTASPIAKVHVQGEDHGVLGITTEHNHAGVRGENTDGGHGVEGVSTGTLAGVSGSNTASGIGVIGGSTNSLGMFASGSSGITAFNFSTSGVAVFGSSQVANGGLAGQFMGNVQVIGQLSKSSGSFKIDHPLDPQNKYLYHSFIESPDMMNIYNGNVTTSEDGEATVVLPDYFEALNRDFRYQLTVVGQFARAMVASTIKNNSFIIKTDQPSVEVSWQVTGIRQDAYANANRIQVEEEKPIAERGSFLHPEAYGQSAKRAEEADLPPEAKELIKKHRKQRSEETL
jgi:hypothetical protein